MDRPWLRSSTNRGVRNLLGCVFYAVGSWRGGWASLLMPVGILLVWSGWVDWPTRRISRLACVLAGIGTLLSMAGWLANLMVTVPGSASSSLWFVGLTATQVLFLLVARAEAS